jgi:hypothetical protein
MIKRDIKNIGLSILFILSSIIANAEELNLIEKRKEYSFVFNTQSGDQLSIENQFGEIKIILWNQKNVKASIVVIANAPTNAMLDTFIGTVNIDGQKSGNKINIKTDVQKENYSFKSIHKDKNTNLKIDYVVYIPRELGVLNINNNFGKVLLPNLDFQVKLNLNYCDLIAENLENENNSLNLNFGSAQINKLIGGDLNANFTKLNLGQIKNVNLKNNNGVFNANFLENIEGILNYSQGVLGQIKDEVKLKLNYTNNLRIDKIDSKLKNLEIMSNYSNVNLPITEAYNGEFDFKTNHGKFYFDPNLNIHFIKNSENEKNKNIKISNYYQGKLGKTNHTTSKIIIVTNYGDIKIK